MEQFAKLYEQIDQTTLTNGKVQAMADYFAGANRADAAWGVFFLTGRRINRLIKSRDLWSWTLQRTNLPEWMVSECYSIVGDAAETVSLLLDQSSHMEVDEQDEQTLLAFAVADVRTNPTGLSEWVQRLMMLASLDRPGQRRAVFAWWGVLEGTELFLFNKMLTGELRVGVSQRLVVRALARFSGLDEANIAHRLTGDWTPSASWFESLVSPARKGTAERQPGPYPFFLASPLTQTPNSLGDLAEWLIEYKYDGIRAQIIRRAGEVSIWSRGNEVLTDRFPEVRDAALQLPDGTVLDGEITAFRDGRFLSFSVLQRRIGRLALTPKIRQEAPAAFVAFDLLEEGGRDFREFPLQERRERLEGLLAGAGDRVKGRLVLSPAVAAADWKALAEVRSRSRELNVEGVMIKRLSSVYKVGRRRGDWWKWKIEPYTIDAVLIYAEPGHGRRANLLTDYTFAVWDEQPRSEAPALADPPAPLLLTPVAKAYSGLNAEEIIELDNWIRQHTTERFGPVRAVEPVHVFELHFEGLSESDRHRSGIALRFPRIASWRRDKRAEQADSLERVKELLRAAR